MSRSFPLIFGIPLLCACTVGIAKPGLALQPDGPALEQVNALGDQATVDVIQEGFQVVFKAGSGKPSVTFSFKDSDINERLGLAIEVRNAGRQAVRLYADLNGDSWVRGFVTVAPGKQETLYVFERRMKLAPEMTAQFPGMHGVPGGKMSLWAGCADPIVAKSLKVFMVAPREDARVTLQKLRPFGSSKVPALTNLFPFIDRYGQYKHKNWPGKIHGNADFRTALDRENLDLAAHPGPLDVNRYGGWTHGPKLNATGHFRVEKYEGRWWLVDPEGRLFWSHGLVGVSTTSPTRIQGRENMFEDPAPQGKFISRNLQIKFGEAWSSLAEDRLLQRMRSWGLNTLGGWGEPRLTQKQKMPYTLVVHSSAGSGKGSKDIKPESEAWQQCLRAQLSSAAVFAKDDPWCIGIFVDNEVHVSAEPAWWQRYYQQVSAAAKELLPNKLYLGSRLDYHDWPDVPAAKKEIVRLAAKYCDVISFNFYKFTLDDVVLPEGVDRPMIIGEFHFGALDRGPLHTGLRSVVDQDQRAEAYRHYVTGALRDPAIVGAHWFRCYDFPTTGRGDGENYQIGFLDTCDTPYWETIAAARDLGYQLYAIRSARR